MGAARVLVVAEDPAAGIQLRTYLSREGFDVSVAAGGEAALQLVGRRLPDMALLDMEMAGTSAMDFCRLLRCWSCLPIIALSSWTAEQDIVRALGSGIDAYVTKPLSLELLSARIRAELRHAAGAPLRPEVLLGDGALRVDFLLRQVWRYDQEVKLTPREYDVLKYLVQHRDRDLRYWKILRAVWGRLSGDGRSQRRYVSRLLRKLEPDPAHPRHLLLYRGSGCRLRS